MAKKPLRWLKIISGEEVLSKIKHLLSGHGKNLKALIVFGSSVYNPLKSRDIDLLVVIDKLNNVWEKTSLEVEVKRSLKNTHKPIDATVLDVESFKENLEPGAFASGLVAGFKLIYDELGVGEMIKETIEKTSKEQIIIIKRGRRLNLSLIARLKTITNGSEV